MSTGQQQSPIFTDDVTKEKNYINPKNITRNQINKFLEKYRTLPFTQADVNEGKSNQQHTIQQPIIVQNNERMDTTPSAVSAPVLRDNPVPTFTDISESSRPELSTDSVNGRLGIRLQRQISDDPIESFDTPSDVHDLSATEKTHEAYAKILTATKKVGNDVLSRLEMLIEVNDGLTALARKQLDVSNQQLQNLPSVMNSTLSQYSKTLGDTLANQIGILREPLNKCLHNLETITNNEQAKHNAILAATDNFRRAFDEQHETISKLISSNDRARATAAPSSILTPPVVNTVVQNMSSLVGDPHFKTLSELFDAQQKSAANDREVSSQFIESNTLRLASVEEKLNTLLQKFENMKSNSTVLANASGKTNIETAKSSWLGISSLLGGARDKKDFDDGKSGNGGDGGVEVLRQLNENMTEIKKSLGAVNNDLKTLPRAEAINMKKLAAEINQILQPIISDSQVAIKQCTADQMKTQSADITALVKELSTSQANTLSSVEKFSLTQAKGFSTLESKFKGDIDKALVPYKKAVERLCSTTITKLEETLKTTTTPAIQNILNEIREFSNSTSTFIREQRDKPAFDELFERRNNDMRQILNDRIQALTHNPMVINSNSTVAVRSNETNEQHDVATMLSVLQSGMDKILNTIENKEVVMVSPNMIAGWQEQLRNAYQAGSTEFKRVIDETIMSGNASLIEAYKQQGMNVISIGDDIVNLLNTSRLAAVQVEAFKEHQSVSLDSLKNHITTHSQSALKSIEVTTDTLTQMIIDNQTKTYNTLVTRHQQMTTRYIRTIENELINVFTNEFDKYGNPQMTSSIRTIITDAIENTSREVIETKYINKTSNLSALQQLSSLSLAPGDVTSVESTILSDVDISRIASAFGLQVGLQLQDTVGRIENAMQLVPVNQATAEASSPDDVLNYSELAESKRMLEHMTRHLTSNKDMISQALEDVMKRHLEAYDTHMLERQNQQLALPTPVTEAMANMQSALLPTQANALEAVVTRNTENRDNMQRQELAIRKENMKPYDFLSNIHARSFVKTLDSIPYDSQAITSNLTTSLKYKDNIKAEWRRAFGFFLDKINNESDKNSFITLVNKGLENADFMSSLSELQGLDTGYLGHFNWLSRKYNTELLRQLVSYKDQLTSHFMEWISQVNLQNKEHNLFTGSSISQFLQNPKAYGSHGSQFIEFQGRIRDLTATLINKLYRRDFAPKVDQAGQPYLEDINGKIAFEGPLFQHAGIMGLWQNDQNFMRMLKQQIQTNELDEAATTVLAKVFINDPYEMLQKTHALETYQRNVFGNFFGTTGGASSGFSTLVQFGPDVIKSQLMPSKYPDTIPSLSNSELVTNLGTNLTQTFNNSTVALEMPYQLNQDTEASTTDLDPKIKMIMAESVVTQLRNSHIALNMIDELSQLQDQIQSGTLDEQTLAKMMDEYQQKGQKINSFAMAAFNISNATSLKPDVFYSKIIESFRNWDATMQLISMNPNEIPAKRTQVLEMQSQTKAMINVLQQREQAFLQVLSQNAYPSLPLSLLPPSLVEAAADSILSDKIDAAQSGSFNPDNILSASTLTTAAANTVSMGPGQEVVSGSKPSKNFRQKGKKSNVPASVLPENRASSFVEKKQQRETVVQKNRERESIYSRPTSPNDSDGFMDASDQLPTQSDQQQVGNGMHSPIYSRVHHLFRNRTYETQRARKHIEDMHTHASVLDTHDIAKQDNHRSNKAEMAIRIKNPVHNTLEKIQSQHNAPKEETTKKGMGMQSTTPLPLLQCGICKGTTTEGKGKFHLTKSDEIVHHSCFKGKGITPKRRLYGESVGEDISEHSEGKKARDLYYRHALAENMSRRSTVAKNSTNSLDVEHDNEPEIGHGIDKNVEHDESHARCKHLLIKACCEYVFHGNEFDDADLDLLCCMISVIMHRSMSLTMWFKINFTIAKAKFLSSSFCSHKSHPVSHEQLVALFNKSIPRDNIIKLREHLLAHPELVELIIFYKPQQDDTSDSNSSDSESD